MDESSHNNKTLCYLFQNIKPITTSNFPELKKLPSLWTSGYFVSTAGNISSEAVKRYTEDSHRSVNQERHGD
ncbi:MAG: transposase [Microcoleus sp.]